MIHDSRLGLSEDRSAGKSVRDLLTIQQASSFSRNSFLARMLQIDGLVCSFPQLALAHSVDDLAQGSLQLTWSIAVFRRSTVPLPSLASLALHEIYG